MTKFKNAVELLKRFAEDYQFDENDPRYMGILNVGIDLLTDPEDKETWTYICYHPQLFTADLHKL